MTRTLLLSYLSMAAAMATVGSTIVASKLMSQMPVFVAMVMRFGVASVLLVILLLLLRKPVPRLARASWKLLLLQAAIGSVAYSVLLMAGLTLTQAADASVIAGALPAMTTLLAVLALRERPNAASWAAVGCATAGLIILQLAATPGPGAESRWLGNGLVLLAVGCEAVFLLLNKRLAEPLDPLWTATLMSIFSLSLCLPLAAVQWLVGVTPVLSPQGVAAAVYYALVPTTLGFWWWYLGSSRVSGTEAGIFTALFPVSGLLLSVAFLGERVETRHWVGISLTVLAIVVSASLGRAPPASR